MNMLNFLLGECKALVDRLPHTCTVYVFKDWKPEPDRCPRCRMIMAIQKVEGNDNGPGNPRAF